MGTHPLRTAALVLATAAATAASAAPEAGRRQVAGWVENVTVFPGALKLRAKLDSGARTSSLHASRIERFERDGRSWVRFTLHNGAGEQVHIERPVIRSVTIKRHFGRRQTRPVINLTLCLGAVLKDTEVNLVDRSGFLYQLLIGRSFLKGDYYIDPGRTFRQPPRCAEPS